MPKNILYLSAYVLITNACGLPIASNPEQDNVKPSVSLEQPSSPKPNSPINGSPVNYPQRAPSPTTRPVNAPANSPAPPIVQNNPPKFQKVELFGNPGCGLCRDSEELLRKKGIKYTFTDIHTTNQKKGQEIRDKYHPPMYPYVFINDEFIGGKAELKNRLSEIPDAPNTQGTPSQPVTQPSI